MHLDTIPQTYREALCLNALLSKYLKYRSEDLRIGVSGDKLYVGVVSDQLHFLAGDIPATDILPSHADTVAKVDSTWKNCVQAYNDATVTERTALLLSSRAYQHRDKMSATFVERGIRPPALLS